MKKEIKEINTYSHEENWAVCNKLEEDGYFCTVNAVWTKIYRLKDEIVVVNLIYDFGKENKTCLRKKKEKN